MRRRLTMRVEGGVLRGAGRRWYDLLVLRRACRLGGTREAMLLDFLIGAHAAVTGRPLLTQDPRRVATHIPGPKLIAPGEPSSTPSEHGGAST